MSPGPERRGSCARAGYARASAPPRADARASPLSSGRRGVSRGAGTALPPPPNRRTTSTADGGPGGRKADGGTRRPTVASNCARHRPWPGADPVAQRRATWTGTIRSARTSRLPGASSRRRRAVVIPKGGLATTRKGRRGSARSVASVRTTVTAMPSNRVRRSSARRRWSSTATTRAPAATRGAVIAPVPAPTSSTRSFGLIPAAVTKRWAYPSVSWCHPHRDRSAAGTDHHGHRHAVSLAPGGAAPPPNIVTAAPDAHRAGASGSRP